MDRSSEENIKKILTKDGGGTVIRNPMQRVTTIPLTVALRPLEAKYRKDISVSPGRLKKMIVDGFWDISIITPNISIESELNNLLGELSSTRFNYFSWAKNENVPLDIDGLFASWEKTRHYNIETIKQKIREIWIRQP